MRIYGTRAGMSRKTPKSTNKMQYAKFFVLSIFWASDGMVNVAVGEEVAIMRGR